MVQCGTTLLQQNILCGLAYLEYTVIYMHVLIIILLLMTAHQYNVCKAVLNTHNKYKRYVAQCQVKELLVWIYIHCSMF